MKPTRKLNKVMLNGVLSCVLAMGIGTTTAYADGDVTSGTMSVTTNTVAVQTVSDDGPTLTWTSHAPNGLIRALISLAEKVQIVLTVDGTERAKLLDSLTQDKIEDANDQLEAGNTDLAATTLNNAITDQSLAVLLTALITSKTDDEADKPDKAEKAEKAEKADPEDKNEAKKKAVLAKQIRHNIEQLTHALNKVKNPTAKVELEQKINNRLNKLSEKLNALQTTVDQNSQVQVTVPTTTVKNEDKLAQTNIEVKNDSEDEDKDNADDNGDKQEAHKKQMETFKAQHEKLKADKKEAQAKWKATQKQLKQQKQQKQNSQGNDDDHDDDHDE